MQPYLPYLVQLITLVAGLYIWRWQLIQARRYEVIERAAIAADDVVEALTQIREAENDVERRAADLPGGVPLARWMATAQQIQAHEGKFLELRAAARLVTMHLGEEFGKEFSALVEVHKDICRALTALLYSGAAERLYPSISYDEGLAAWERQVRSTGEGDEVAENIAAISQRIAKLREKYLRPPIPRRLRQYCLRSDR